MRPISAAGRKFINDREADKLRAYQDGGGVWTIGRGHTGSDVHPGMEITEAESDRLFDLDLADHNIEPLLDGVPAKQCEYDAMTSLAFNIGMERFRNSTVLKRHKLGNRIGAANAFLLWKFDNGNVVPGLVHRRELERKMYLGESA
jgi:lysozyme